MPDYILYALINFLCLMVFRKDFSGIYKNTISVYVKQAGKYLINIRISIV